VARIEVLGALCGASVNYSGVRGSGALALQGVELAGYLAGLGPAETALAMAKYMGDDASLLSLRILVCGMVDDISFNEKWFSGFEGFQLKQDMAELAIEEVVSPAVCKRCDGVGFVGARSCLKCHGTGHVAMSNNAVAESLRMHHETFKRHWRDRYGRVLAKVQSFDAEIHRAVSRQVCADMEVYL
jgi:hypothetical protein